VHASARRRSVDLETLDAAALAEAPAEAEAE
jgi:hypothetical protein